MLRRYNEEGIDVSDIIYSDDGSEVSDVIKDYKEVPTREDFKRIYDALKKNKAKQSQGIIYYEGDINNEEDGILEEVLFPRKAGDDQI